LRIEHLTECGLAIRELIVAEVFPVQVKQVEGEENGISTARQPSGAKYFIPDSKIGVCDPSFPNT
jgi:hypothetical protein